MILYVVVIIICLIPLLFGQNKKTLFCSFALLWIFASLRCDFGDYPGYYYFWSYAQDKTFKDIFPFINSFSDIFFKKNISSVSSEFGYLFLSKIIPGNFIIFVSVLTAFYIFSAYKLIIKYVPEKYYFLSFILFIDPIIFLTNLSAMRQTLALSFLLLFIPYLIEKKYFMFCLGIILATLCHKSAIVFITLPILYYTLEKKLYSLIFLFLICFLPMSMVLFSGGFFQYIDFYNGYIEKGGRGNIMYTIFLIILPVFNLYIVDKNNITLFFFVLIYSLIISLRLLCLFPGGGLITRYNLYIEELAIVIFPLVAFGFKKIFLRDIFIIFCIFFVITRIILCFATPERIGSREINFLKQNIFVEDFYFYKNN